MKLTLSPSRFKVLLIIEILSNSCQDFFTKTLRELWNVMVLFINALECFNEPCFGISLHREAVL